MNRMDKDKWLVSACVLLALSACNPGNSPGRHGSVDDGDGISASAVHDEANAANATDISVIVKYSTLDADSSSGWTAARFSTAGLVARTPQRTGNAAAGRRALLEESYVSCGLPERVFRQLQAGQPVQEISGRDSVADGLPYNVNAVQNAEGVDIVSSNCLTCHASPLFGELVIGLGNEFLDFTRDASVLAERAGALVKGDRETAAWQRYADRIAAIAPYIRTHTTGVNPANNLTFALIAHRQASDNSWSEEPLLPLPPTDPPPVSVPPWWRMQKKPAMFNLGEGRGDHARIMMAASMLCSDNRQELDRIDSFAPDIRAFIASLKPPAWPFDIDEHLAVDGQVVFEANCSTCHGTYGEKPEYPARLVPLGIIGTDATLVEFAQGDGIPYIDWFNRSYYGERSTAAPGPGYMAPPLDGIWATAPYLHNGSVPDIRSLLDSSTRPVYWQHTAQDASDPKQYDQLNLGWHYQRLDAGKPGRDDPARVYDTTLPGYANTGHPFGDHLDDGQRSAVLEYLKTL